MGKACGKDVDNYGGYAVIKVIHILSTRYSQVYPQAICLFTLQKVELSTGFYLLYNKYIYLYMIYIRSVILDILVYIFIFISLIKI